MRLLWIEMQTLFDHKTCCLNAVGGFPKPASVRTGRTNSTWFLREMHLPMQQQLGQEAATRDVKLSC